MNRICILSRLKLSVPVLVSYAILSTLLLSTNGSDHFGAPSKFYFNIRTKLVILYLLSVTRGINTKNTESVVSKRPFRVLHNCLRHCPLSDAYFVQMYITATAHKIIYTLSRVVDIYDILCIQNITQAVDRLQCK